MVLPEDDSDFAQWTTPTPGDVRYRLKGDVPLISGDALFERPEKAANHSAAGARYSMCHFKLSCMIRWKLLFD
jgi:hypothetical protein